MTDPVFEQPVPKEDITMVALGDSLTKGVGDPDKKGYVGDVQDQLKEKKTIGQVDVYNYGVKGDNSDDLLKKLQNQNVLNHIEKADLIVFTIGGNDMMDVVKNHFLELTVDLFQQKMKHYQDNLAHVLKALRDHNDHAQILYVGVFDPFSAYFSDVKETGQIIENWDHTGKRATTKFHDTAFIPTFDLFVNKTDSLLSDDHFHPNSRGYQLIGKRVMDNINVEHLTDTHD